MLSNKILKFFCPDCRENLENLPSLHKHMQTLQDEVDELKKMLNSLQEKPSYSEVLKNVQKDGQRLRAEITAIREAVEKSDFDSELESAKESARKLKEEVEGLRAAARGGSSSKGSLSPVEPAVQEMLERGARASNLLLFGMKESEGRNREERSKHEKEAVRRVIGGISEGFNVESVKIFRLGKYSEGKLRPIKVSFSTREEAIRVLRQKSKLSGTDSVYIKADMTLAQRQYLKQLLAELEERRKQEHDLVLRYINGVPKIVQSRRGHGSSPSKN